VAQEQKHVTKLDVIQMSLDTADDWERKGEPGWAQNCLATAVMNYLSLAVEEYPEMRSAVAWLDRCGVGNLLQRVLKNTQVLADRVEAKALPSPALGGNYHYLVYAHLAWALREFDRGEWFVAFGQRGDVLQISTPFWREYARGMGALVKGQAYESASLKLRGQERYWVSYLQLIEIASRGEDLTDALAGLDRAFAARNADKRIKDDSYEIEGSALHPVRWDYRRDSLLGYIRRHR
jgi:hypothetical protein